MFTSKIFHNVVKPFAAETVTKSTSETSDWIDISGWVDLKVAYDMDGGAGLDYDVDMLISSHDAYELNNSITETTEDYTTLSLASGATATVYTTVDSDDVDDLKHPIRSCAIKVTANDAAADMVANVWIEGQA